MVADLKVTKDKFLQFMERLIEDRGIERCDVKLMGEYADIIKDLAEAEEKCWKAEYYRTVTEAMRNDSSGYGRTGYDVKAQPPTTNKEMRRGYDNSGSETLMAIREMMSKATPEVKAQLRNELPMYINS